MSWTSTARAQAGYVTRRQLHTHGIAAATIGGWLRAGRLEQSGTDGVYRLAGSADCASMSSWYAVLATRSPLSFVSAAAWWDMLSVDDGDVHVTRADRRRLDWPTHVRVHRVALSPSDVVEHRGLLVTTRCVTALDTVGWLSPGRSLAFAHRAVQQRWVTTDDIRERLETQPGRWGNRRLRTVLRTLERGADAESERRLHRLLRAAGVSGWVPQLRVLTPSGAHRVDVAFPSRRLAIEIDGYAYHSSDARFQTDRTRQNALIAAGWRVLRFTWADIVDRPDHVVAQIVTLLAA